MKCSRCSATLETVEFMGYSVTKSIIISYKIGDQWAEVHNNHPKQITAMRVEVH